MKTQFEKNFEDLILFRELESAGRIPGAIVGTVDEPLEFIRGLERENG